MLYDKLTDAAAAARVEQDRIAAQVAERESVAALTAGHVLCALVSEVFDVSGLTATVADRRGQAFTIHLTEPDAERGIDVEILPDEWQERPPRSTRSDAMPYIVRECINKTCSLMSYTPVIGFTSVDGWANAWLNEKHHDGPCTEPF